MADPNLPVTLATFLYLVRHAGIPLLDPRVEAACGALDGGGEDVAALGRALVDLVAPKLGAGSVEEVVAALRELCGADRIGFDSPADGVDRDARVAGIRRASFGRNLPWLAQIADRVDGVLGVHWVMVEDFTDEVRVMDPNPWDDRPEERTFDLPDFLVRWELAGAPCVRVA